MDAKDYLQYNLTIRLGSLLALPSKFLHRLRRIDDLLNHDLDVQSAALSIPMPVTTSFHSGVSDVARPPPSRSSLSYEITTMPGPFAFMTSGYALGLIALALLLNRIQHIVVPPRRSLAYRIVRSRRSVFHALFYSFFPVDLSSTAYRFTLRIPSLYLLYKSLALLFVILLQVSNLFPSAKISWLQRLGGWAERKEMEDVCWSIFGTVCTALVVGALTRGLEGFNSSNTQPFNIFGYAMLLHIYSMPVTHANRSTPTRPDINVLLTLLFPLLQLALVHSLGIRKKWAKYRLVPTTICSLATIIHFNAVLFTKPASYPMLNYLPCLLETLLLLITLLTITLNALTQLLLEGEITRPLFGHAQTLAPKWDEDFAIALLRLGTASLEATNVAGLGNEVGPITIGDSQLVDAQVKKDRLDSEGTIHLNSAGVVSITRVPVAKGGSHNKGGFGNEIKNVKVKNSEDDWLIDHLWLRELTRFGLSLFSVVRGLFRFFLWLIWYKWKGIGLRRPTVDADARLSGDTSVSNFVHADFRQRDTSDDVYSRFLRGEDVSDDEEEYSPTRDHALLGSSPDDAGQNSEEGEEEPDTENDDSDDGNGLETARLYSDLLTNSATSSSISPGPVLIAHMTSDYASPLTRRRYNELVALPHNQLTSDTAIEQGKDEFGDFIRDRRVRASTVGTGTSSVGDLSQDGRMNCVICTSEPREIICWPCRCLALCNDCRENLASRVSASKHMCPCCRRNVEGYSRIYIP
ncbi:uncharacterized protein FOMMEDRAFT_168701 [Fomitiporia mediterranea MF3/22]|uniref:uncharacterized protein n=1 Tax=Fomitiporia mediterranea (strain MF3/22) TaxID=694068 RepID=UPI0004407B1F|nr:uncharacterized protein FOMMEDRAFT_168701 [Fomitiporia mediterranea MF3/22]EJD02179.1 hypothetical protein FOMMEDRAFT_168701 [Fomitiporia mediterranea MF3/22]